VNYRGGWILTSVAVGALAVCRLVAQVEAVSRGGTFAATSLSIDDTYYYLLTAWNHTRLGFSTFDGLHATNGVQLLWYLWTVMLAAISPTRETLLTLSLGSCALLNALAFAFIWRFSRLIQSPIAALTGAACWFALTPRYLNAMENSLHAFLFWWLLFRLTRLVTRLAAGEPVRRDIVASTVLISAVVWTRLDSVFVVVPGVAFVAWRLFTALAPVEFRRAAVTSAFIAAMAAGGLFGGYYLLAGTPLPVSVTIKTASYQWDSGVLQSVVRNVFNEPFAHLPAALLQSLPENLAGAVALGAGVLLALWLSWRFGLHRRGRPDLRATVGLLAALATGAAAHIFYLGGLGDYAVYGFWYLSPVLIVVIALAALGFAISVTAPGTALPNAPRERVFVYGLAGMLLVTGLTIGVRGATGRLEYRTDELYVRRLQIATVLRNTLPAGTLLGAWNAGQLGFFSGLPVVNLDGLINSADFNREIRPRRDLQGDVLIDHPQALMTYLQRTGVRYVVDWEVDAILKTGLYPINNEELRRQIEKHQFGIGTPWR
jgi:hypothetical protein